MMVDKSRHVNLEPLWIDGHGGQSGWLSQGRSQPDRRRVLAVGLGVSTCRGDMRCIDSSWHVPSAVPAGVRLGRFPVIGIHAEW